MDIDARRMALLILAATCSSLTLAQITISPGQPREGETVRVQVPTGGLGPLSSDDWDVRAHRVSMASNKITVGIVTRGLGATLPEPSPKIDKPLGQFPEGAYQVDVQVESPDRTVIRSVGSASFSVTPKSNSDPLLNLTDLWWNPNESGWGINLVQHPSGVMFGTWFVYGSDGRPTWYVIPDARTSDGVIFNGQVYRTSGPPFCIETSEPCPGTPFNPGAVNATPVGQAFIGFVSNDYDRARISITVGGKTVAKDVRRQSF